MKLARLFANLKPVSIIDAADRAETLSRRGVLRVSGGVGPGLIIDIAIGGPKMRRLRPAPWTAKSRSCAPSCASIPTAR